MTRLSGGANMETWSFDFQQGAGRRPLILRRRKADVLDDLPEKIEDVRTCQLSAQQEVLYRQILERHGATIDMLPVDRGAAFEMA